MTRFWERVNKTEGCWEWTSILSSSGYGRIYFNGGMKAAHRVSWELKNGPIPAGLFVCHKCDNRKCVRPGHLFLGSALDNSRDMVKKKRAATGDRNGTRKYPETRPRGKSHGMNTMPWRRTYGESNGQCKLSETKVSAIRIKRKEGMKLKDLSKKYLVSMGTISRICTGTRRSNVRHGGKLK